MDGGGCGQTKMNLTDKKIKSVYFIETAYLYLLSCIVIYYTLLFLSKINLFELSHTIWPLWRLNPYSTLPYLIAIILGMVLVPLVWEKLIRSTDLKEIGFAVPTSFNKEIICGAGLFCVFVVYSYVLLSKWGEFLSLSPNIILSLSIYWLFAALGEEVLYRGIIQRRLCVLCGEYCGLILASVLFAFVGHSRAPLIDNLVFRLPFGLVLGYLYLRSHSLLIPVGIHCGFNVLFVIGSANL
ncbi:MAG: lysostaphin resistance A-like protein [Sedimentisphaerales bacterium]